VPDKAGNHTAHHDLENVVEYILDITPNPGRLSVGDLMHAIGERSFGPLILVPSLIALSPVGAIPGLPAVTSAIVILLTLQMLAGQRYFWLPNWLKQRTIDGAKLEKGLKAFRPVARFVDHFLRPRMAYFTRGVCFYVIAVLILLVACVTPILELVPLGGIPPNAALVAFALAIIARDGLWALVAFTFTAASIYWLVGMM
jgi:hypothetical protein